MASMEDSDRQSGTLIGSNDDLLAEILIRLPVTSILRFKSVSKHRRLLLSHQHFTHRYDINNNNNLSKSVGLFGQSIYVPFDVETRSPPPISINNSLDFYFNRLDVTIKQSCNGLLLCSALNNDYDCEYYVFNPTTKQLAIIPSPPKDIKTMALAYHQIQCVHYKLVCVCYLDRSSRLLQIQVYSSDTRKWKICIESFHAYTSEFHHSVYWNGAVHWAPAFQIGYDFLYFILDVEQLQKLPKPEESVYDDDDNVSTMYFGESRDHLHFISQTNCEDRIMNVNVYEMLRDRSGWFVKYRVQFNELPGFPEMFDYNSGVVDVVRGNEEEEETFLVLVTGYPMRLMRYNVRDKSFNPIYTPPKTNDDDFYDGDSIDVFYDQTSSYFRYIEVLSSF